MIRCRLEWDWVETDRAELRLEPHGVMVGMLAVGQGFVAVTEDYDGVSMVVLGDDAQTIARVKRHLEDSTVNALRQVEVAPR